MNIDKIIHDKFIPLLDKETINNISLLNHSIYGTLTDEDYRGDSPYYKWSKVVPGMKNYSTWKYLSEEEARRQ